MVGGFRGVGRVAGDVAGFYAVGIIFRYEDVVEPDVRVPDGEGVAFVGGVGVEIFVGVDVAFVEHDLDSTKSNSAAENQSQQAQAAGQPVHLELFAGGERVEIAGDDVERI